MAEEHTAFIESPSEDTRVMNDTLGEHMKATSDKVITITRGTLPGDDEAHGWYVTIEVE
ncbi:MAG: hypothetical protein QGG42_01240 [Phycisphaerae bacterium]|jgi:hypothetical protein|nr:hypothetical protein [Phycisphaerae bacterium]